MSTTSGPALAAAAGVSYRQLDHWTRMGYVLIAPSALRALDAVLRRN